MTSSSYDVAAYVWPAFHDDPRSRIFWARGLGEWELVLDSRPKYPGHDQPRRPLWGYVNEADPRVMEMQINAAADHGVNVFIYDWYWYDSRPFLEECLNQGFLGAANNDRMKFYLMWSNHDAPTVWDLRNSHDRQVVWGGGVDRTEFEKVTARIVEKYLMHDCYYRIDGKPVFAIYDLVNLCDGLGGTDVARDALDWFREYAVSAGLPGLHLQGILRRRQGADTAVHGDEHATSPELVEALGLDSVTHYQWCLVTEPKGDYQLFGQRGVEEWSRVDREYSAAYVPHVTIGWDNNCRFTATRDNVVTGETADAFARFLREAREFIDARPGQASLITVNSWNEWSESSYLQPDVGRGYSYLEAVKSVFLTQGDKSGTGA
ncbi:glycoside hydrolase family 99-like domain-containing protein [Kribbella sp. NPDC050124]|uniref:glycoside hydrolase family 99-like domain-containing protein n=1 Tax=Kribbella sp. NPDC050124 TaxID=3364114 RepID=UPI0037A2DE12